MSCKYNNCKHCGYKSECEIYKENAELRVNLKWEQDTKSELAELLGKANDEISELEQQIEKMKCCENCKHSDTECEGYTICGIGHYDDCLSNKVLYHTTDEKDYWELEEND